MEKSSKISLWAVLWALSNTPVFWYVSSHCSRPYSVTKATSGPGQGAREVWESNLHGFGDTRGTKPSVFLSQPQSNNKNSLVSPAQEPAPLQTAMVPPDYSFSTSTPAASRSSPLPFLALPPWPLGAPASYSPRAGCFVCTPPPRPSPLPSIVLLGHTTSCMAEVPLLSLFASGGESGQGSQLNLPAPGWDPQWVCGGRARKVSCLEKERSLGTGASVLEGPL